MNALTLYTSKTMVNLSELNRSIDDIIEQRAGCVANAAEIVSPFVFQALMENLFNTKFDCIVKQKVPYFIETIFDLFSALNLYAVFSFVSKSRLVVYFMAGVNQIFFQRLTQCKYFFYVFVELNKMVWQVHGRLSNAQNVPEELSLFETMVLTNIVKKKSYFEKIQGYFNVMNHGNLFIISGYTSTTTAITDILYNLAKYPDIQKKLADEIDNFEQLLNGEEMTYSCLKGLHYLNAVIKESIRLNPPLNFIGRMNSTPEVINERLTIPANVDILISLQQILRSDKYFHEPERFYPERHLEQQTDWSILSNCSECDDVNWCTETAYIPFSTGLRVCPGRDYSLMQIKLFLINLLSKYSIQLHGQVDHSVQQHITLQYLRNFGLKIYRRS